MRNALPCIACGRELLNVEDGATNQPSNGTTFQSYGHYGSTAYDPMDGRFIEVNICDLCLITHADRVYEGKDVELIMKDGSVSGTRKMKQPWRLVRWSVSRKEFDHTVGSALAHVLEVNP